ncbi:MAG: acetyl-CoA carboxylase biotin carboxyl carrier protein, partial [Clostridia bacterium]|nr:acetyl-CoA carboxylase biotin carboxyl carrier protein [Clostridia bacterium]
ELMSEFKKSGIAKLDLKDGDFSIRLEMPEQKTVNAVQLSAAPQIMNVPEAAAPAMSEKPAAAAPEGEFIKSPIVGTFYAAPGEGMDPYVRVGKTVKKGDTVCIIEAMKMMNEIAAPYDCVIEEVLKENEEAAGFDDLLFRIRGL